MRTYPRSVHQPETAIIEIVVTIKSTNSLPFAFFTIEYSYRPPFQCRRRHIQQTGQICDARGRTRTKHEINFGRERSYVSKVVTEPRYMKIPVSWRSYKKYHVYGAYPCRWLQMNVAYYSVEVSGAQKEEPHTYLSTIASRDFKPTPSPSRISATPLGDVRLLNAL